MSLGKSSASGRSGGCNYQIHYLHVISIMNFPTIESEVVSLVKQMLYGYMWHSEHFPHVVRAKLNLAHRTYYLSDVALTDVVSAVRLATESKDESLLMLKKIMRQCLKKAIVDTTNCPQKLRLIGWSARSAPSKAEMPGQPLNFNVFDQSGDGIELRWQRPSSGADVRNYILQRRLLTGKEAFGKWEFIGISYDCRIILTGQPRGIRLEYRVNAVNTAGDSNPSNTQALIL
jgi:hypothetical protein